MQLKKKIVIAAVAAAALGLSACGGDATSEPTTAETTAAVEPTTADQTTAPAEETAPAETEETAPEEPAEPAGDFPFEEGPVDSAEFVARYGAAMQGVEQMTITSTTPGSEPSVTQVDNSDPANPRSYAVIETMGQKMEIVTEGTTSWTRIDGGEWTESTVPDLGTGAVTDGSNFAEVELVSKADRQLKVVIDMSSFGAGNIEAQLWVDEQFRAAKTEMEMSGISTSTEYDYDSPVEIPAVS